MRAVKKGRSSSLPKNGGKVARTTVRGGSDPPSTCSSDVGSPRRRLELDDEGSQSLLSNPGSVAAPGGSVQYDATDHTAPLPSRVHSSHMIVLPRSLLVFHGGSPGGKGEVHGNSGAELWHRADIEDARLSGTSVAAGSMCASPKAGVGQEDIAFRQEAVASLWEGCDFVRLPHPRHGGAALFLCPPAIGEGEGEEGHRGVRKPVLYEVQAQSPPGGFGQTWFVGEMVEPNEDLLVVTPFDCTFFALRQASAHAMSDKFLPAEDLITGPVKSGMGDVAWPGWGVAVAQCPALEPAVREMQSHAVLSRICDVKTVGDDNYYRFSTQKMGTWLRAKVKLVTKSPGLRSLLGLKETEENSTEDSSAKGVPLPFAFGVVAEYVPQELCAAAAELCGTAEAGS